MLPNVYGFHWTPVHVIFLGVFFTVAIAIAATLVVAALRARRDLRRGKLTSIRWHSEFEELPLRDRVCRHELTGDFAERHCDNAFDCRRCATHAKLVAASAIAPADDQATAGLVYPADRLYHRGHTWVKEEPDGLVTVGPDPLATHMFGQLDQVQLPARGARVEVNGVAWTVKKNGEEFRVLSPVDGDVISVGGPDDGYYVKIRPAGGKLNSTHLLRDAEVRPWVMHELQRLQILVSPDPSTPLLADGGVLIDDAPAAFPAVNWPAIWGEMLLDP